MTRSSVQRWHGLSLSLFVLLAMLPLFPPPAAAAPADGTGDVSWTGFLSEPSKHTSTWIAYAFLEHNKRRLGIRRPHSDLVVTEIGVDDPARTRIHLQRMLYRTPVWGDRLVIEIDDEGIVRQVAGTLHPRLEQRLLHQEMHPAISASRASDIARHWLQSQQLPDTDRRLTGDALLCYLPDPSGVRLVYAIGADRGGRLFVHARSGRVILPNI